MALKKYKPGDKIKPLGLFPCGTVKVEFIRYCTAQEDGYLIAMTQWGPVPYELHEIHPTPAAKVLFGC